MYFIIIDNDNTRWAYGDINGRNPSLLDICQYLMSSSKPEIFTIIFFTMDEIKETVSLINYVSRETSREEVKEKCFT